MRAEASDIDITALGDVSDIICGAMDFIHLAGMATEKLSHADRNAFASVLSAASDRLTDAKAAIARIRGDGHEN